MIDKILDMIEQKIITAEEAKVLLEYGKINENTVNVSYFGKNGSKLKISIPKEIASKSLENAEIEKNKKIDEVAKNEDILKKIISFVK